MGAKADDRIRIAALPQIDRARQVTEALADYVEQAQMKAGDRLPAERELMSALAVGRSTIREAVRHFQALGVMETRKGSGTYLLKPITSGTVHLPLSLETTSLRDALLLTLEVRRGVECEAAIVAARRRSEADLVMIRERLEEMERVHLAEGTSGKEDLAFHLAIYDATHNPMFRQLLEQMRGAVRAVLEEALQPARLCAAVLSLPPRHSTTRSRLRIPRRRGAKRSRSSTWSRKTSRKCPDDQRSEHVRGGLSHRRA